MRCPGPAERACRGLVEGACPEPVEGACPEPVEGACPEPVEGSPRLTDPSSGSCSVARIRISVDLPAPFRPRRPNIPGGMSSDTPFNAWVPFGYVFDRSRMVRCIYSGWLLVAGGWTLVLVAG